MIRIVIPLSVFFYFTFSSLVFADAGTKNKNAEALVKQGVTYYQERNFEKAYEYFSKAIKEDPYFALAYYKRGTILLINNRIDEAIQDFSTAIKLKPDYANSYSNRGGCYKRKGMYKETIDDYYMAYKLNPKLGVYCYNMAFRQS